MKCRYCGKDIFSKANRSFSVQCYEALGADPKQAGKWFCSLDCMHSYMEANGFKNWAYISSRIDELMERQEVNGHA